MKFVWLSPIAAVAEGHAWGGEDLFHAVYGMPSLAPAPWHVVRLDAAAPRPERTLASVGASTARGRGGELR